MLPDGAKPNMNVAFIGCGYVANMYRLTLPLHPELKLLGVFDQDLSRSRRMAELCACRAYDTQQQLLSDPQVDLVLNLTNPSSHYKVTNASLLAGKHVYTEKPLAMDLGQARSLVELAENRGLHLSSAPCTFLGNTAQTLAKVLSEKKVGRVRLVYAEMDDGMVHRMPYRNWVNEAGTPWPYEDEFKVGCTVEHAGYVLTWLVALFGPATHVSAFSDCLIPEKLPNSVDTPDFSVACVRFGSGVVARLTCGIIAPHDHGMTFVGDEGVVTVDDPRNDWSPVHIRRYMTIRRKRFLLPWKTRCPLVGSARPSVRYRGSQRRDFCRGIADMAAAILEGRLGRLSARFCLHVNELTLAIHNARLGQSHTVTTALDEEANKQGCQALIGGAV